LSFEINGLNHLGLVVDDIEIAKKWFVETLGLKIFQDRGEILFILAGNDVLAVKTAAMAINKPEHGGEDPESFARGKAGWQTLDHYGFFANSPDEVDSFSVHVEKHGATILKGPYSRSDGRSVYFRDPCGNVGEYLFFNPAK
jgi:catechol 2,3-dioxygenase-like lactoylglutathione lyase family enzyme